MRRLFGWFLIATGVVMAAYIPLFLSGASDQGYKLHNKENVIDLAAARAAATDYFSIQAGVDAASTSSDTTTITFTDAFANATYTFCWSVDADVSSNDQIYILGRSAAACTLLTDSATVNLHWIAVGWDS